MLSLRVAATVGLITCYVAMCRGLRYLRRDTEQSQRAYKSREDFQKMTAEDAWEIVKYVQGLEFPWISKKALSFALFKYVTALVLYFNTQLTLAQNLWHTDNLKVALRDSTAWQSRVCWTPFCRHEYLDRRIPWK